MDDLVTQSDVNETIERELPGLPGWCLVDKGKRMAHLARGTNLCVELGVFGGRGIVSMALALKDQGFGRADGIDPYTPAASLEGANDPANDEYWAHLDYESVARAAQEAFYKLELMPYARIIRMRSCDVVDFYADGTIDLLHLDANHSEATSCSDVTLWAPKIRVGGHWIFDDADWPTTQAAQRVLEGLCFDQVENHTQWKVYRRQK
jgi:predicted O-methyltransferase YrrM